MGFFSSLFGKPTNIVQSTYDSLNSSIQSISSSVISEYSSSMSSTGISENDIIIDGTVVCFGTVSVQQKADLSISAMAKLDTNAINNIGNKLTEKVSDIIDKKITQKNGGILADGKNVSVDSTKIKNLVELHASTAVRSGIKTNMSISTDGSNTIRVGKGGVIVGFGHCGFDQEVLIKQIGESTAKSLIGSLASNTEVMEILNKNQLTIDQLNEGLQLPNLTTMLMIFAGLLIALALIRLMKPKSKSKSKRPHHTSTATSDAV